MHVLIKDPSEHSHAPDPDRVHVIRLKNEIKVRGAASDNGASTILFDVLRSTPLTAAPGLPTNEALLQMIRRERPAQQLDQQGCLPPILRQTDRGEDFILYEDNSMVIFTCDKNLSVLNQCKHWFMDGTFSVCISFDCLLLIKSAYLDMSPKILSTIYYSWNVFTSNYSPRICLTYW
jgi:hypothetical protein